MKRKSLILFLSALILAGCASSATYVDISSDRYAPRFNAEKYSVYKEKKLYLAPFTNKAANTSMFYYFSPDFKVQYGQYVIASYYWYCFNKAFNEIGMTIYKDAISSDIPEFMFEFDHLTDRKIDFNVTVTKRLKLIYQRRFSVTMPAPEAGDIAYLENRAYEMVDSIITRILDDVEFGSSLQE